MQGSGWSLSQHLSLLVITAEHHLPGCNALEQQIASSKPKSEETSLDMFFLSRCFSWALVKEKCLERACFLFLGNCSDSGATGTDSGERWSWERGAKPQRQGKCHTGWDS